MIIWISKYALSAGITKHDAEVKDGSAYPGSPFMSYVSFKLGKDAHETLEGAVCAAEAQRVKKIAALKKQTARLEKMRFDAS